MLSNRPFVAIIDFGLGNLFSIRQACSLVGLRTEIADHADCIQQADAVILPGVGAFGEAMAALHRQDLVSVLKETVAEGKPLLGICLGMQLLMTESTEFGLTQGLDFIPGKVRHFNAASEEKLRVPQICWNSIWHGRPRTTGDDPWQGTILEGIEEREYMYFVHSFYVDPLEDKDALARTTYGPCPTAQ